MYQKNLEPEEVSVRSDSYSICSEAITQQKFHKKQVILSNHFIIQLIVDIFIILANFLAMVLYEWMNIQIKYSKNKVWITFLYVFDTESSQMHMLTQETGDFEQSFCLQNYQQQPDKYTLCIESFATYYYVGIGCIASVTLGMVCNALEIIRIILTIRKSKMLDLCILKGRCVQTMIIIFYVVPIGTYIAIEFIYSPLKYTLGCFGFSFYICIGAIMCFIILIIYYRIVKKQYQQSGYMLNLIQEVNNLTLEEKQQMRKEKETARKKQKVINYSIQNM